MWPTHYIPHLNRPGIPPGRFVLTTPPYPVEVTEELFSAGTFDHGRFGIGMEDGMISSGIPVGGILDALSIRTLNKTIEKLISSGAPVTGLLRDILVSFGAPFEKLISSGAPVGGTMLNPVISYTHWPLDTDKLISSGEPVSGVLA